MKVDEPQYYSNPYLPESRVGKGEKISMIRATVLFCITIILSVIVVTFFNAQHDRFMVVPHSEGLYIFDRTTTATNYCTTDKCMAISTEFITPKQVLIAQVPGVLPAGQVAQPSAPQPVVPPQPAAQPQATTQSMVNPSFSMPGMNKTPMVTPPQQSRMFTGNQQPVQSNSMDNSQSQVMSDPMADNDSMENNFNNSQQNMDEENYQNFQ